MFIDANDGVVFSVMRNGCFMLITSCMQLKLIIILRDPIARTMSYVPMAKDAIGKGATPMLRLQTLIERFEACVAGHTHCSEAELWEDCRGSAGVKDPIIDGLYDLQIATWRALFPDRYFCVISNEYYRNNQSLALATIERFTGLPHHNKWLAYHHKSAASNQTADAELTGLLADFFKRHGTFFHDYVREHGYWGCEPHGEP